MKDKKLLDLLEIYLIDGDFNDLGKYISDTKINQHDYKLLALSLLSKERLFYVMPVYNYRKTIENIDNDEFLNDEDNYLI